MFDLLVKNGLIIEKDHSYKGSIAVKDQKIAVISRSSQELQAKKTIDATNKMVFPGVIDCHAHLNEPGYEWRENFLHGSSSAAAGGVTTVLDMPLQNKPPLTTTKAFWNKANIVGHSAIVDYAFWGGFIDNNIHELEGLCNEGVIGLKAFIGPASSDYSSVSLGLIRDAMERIGVRNIIFGFHCEDYSIVQHEETKAIEENRFNWIDYLRSRPPIAEILSVKSVISLAKETGSMVHICHISHPSVAEEVKKAQCEGVQVTGETCPHYLIFSQEDLLEKGPYYKCAPPLRSLEDKEELWKYVLDGTISCIGSDHSPCAPEEKVNNNVWEVWGGISGIQSIFQIMFNEVVSKRKLCPSLVAQRLSCGPSRVFNLYPKKGVLNVGSDADIIIVDPDREWEIKPDSLLYKNKESAFTGQKGKGLPIITVLRGRVVYENGRITGKPGFGQLLRSEEFLPK